MRAYFVTSVCLAGLTLAGVTNAQSTSQPTPPAAPVNPPPEVIAPKSDHTNKSGAGVLRPPNVDPGMSVKPPDDVRGAGPVIPPPGTPGGDPNVIPK
jgi:hypothetical protein